MIGLFAGASDWPVMCSGDILRSTCGGCRTRRGNTCYGCPRRKRYLLWVPLADHCGGPREKMLYTGKIKDLSLWTWKRNYVKCARHLPLYGRGFQPFLAVRQDCRSFVSGEGRPRTPMGIRGALGPVGYSDPSLRDSRSQLARC